MQCIHLSKPLSVKHLMTNQRFPVLFSGSGFYSLAVFPYVSAHVVTCGPVPRFIDFPMQDDTVVTADRLKKLLWLLLHSDFKCTPKLRDKRQNVAGIS